jgi:hypothetical protein
MLARGLPDRDLNDSAVAALRAATKAVTAVRLRYHDLPRRAGRRLSASPDRCTAARLVCKVRMIRRTLADLIQGCTITLTCGYGAATYALLRACPAAVAWDSTIDELLRRLAEQSVFRRRKWRRGNYARCRAAGRERKRHNSDVEADVALAALGTTQLNTSRSADMRDVSMPRLAGVARPVWPSASDDEAVALGCFYAVERGGFCSGLTFPEGPPRSIECRHRGAPSRYG